MEQAVRTAMTRSLAASPAGRAHLLNFAVAAEEGDEAGIFEQLEGLVDGPRLARLVTRHREDEARHAQMFRDCLARLGLEEQPVPSELLIVRQVAGGQSFAGIRLTRDDVVGTYALLLAIEERGVEQFPLIAEAFEPYDPQTADTYRRVAADEARHVRYCTTIGRHYAADDTAWLQAVEGARAVESVAFRAVGEAELTYTLTHNLVTLAAA